jgi:hypothetical protein
MRGVAKKGGTMTTTPNSNSLGRRLWTRVTDRGRPPRSWWYPLPNPRVRHKDIVKDAHQGCSETTNRAMLTLLGVALFCLLTALGASDKSLLAADTTIKVPFAEAPISFPGFMVVAPLLLIVVTIYLHIFFGYWLDLDRERQQINADLATTDEPPVESVPTLFGFPGPVPRLLTVFVFYWVVPLVLGTMTWKALARPEVGHPVFYLTGVSLYTCILADSSLP